MALILTSISYTKELLLRLPLKRKARLRAGQICKPLGSKPSRKTSRKTACPNHLRGWEFTGMTCVEEEIRVYEGILEKNGTVEDPLLSKLVKWKYLAVTTSSLKTQN